jgi:NitT/TauT family transport system substrate-binding protein
MVFSVTGCTKQSQEKDAPASDRTITIGVMPDVESIPFVIADRKGFFAQEGVKVKIQHFKSAKDRDSALQSGKLDGMITDVLAVVFANEGGIKMRIISKNDGNIKLMAGKDSAIDSINDLKGKNIGLSTNTIMEYSVDRMLESGGVKPEEVKKTAIPQLPTRLEMLQGAKIDAAILPEPLASVAINNGARVLNSTDAMNNKAGAIAFTAQSLQESPNEIKAVFKAYNDAVGYLQKGLSASDMDLLIQTQGFPAGTTIKLPEYHNAEAPSEKIFNDVVQWMQAKKLIKGNYEYKDLVDDKVLR